MEELIYKDLREKKQQRYDNHQSKEKELSSNSLKTYASIIKGLYKDIFKNKGELNPALFNNKFKEVVEYLENYPVNKRRNLYTALYSYTNNDTYQKLMTCDVKDYMEIMKKQEKSEQQDKNWIEFNEVKLKLKELKQQADSLYQLKPEGNFTMTEFQTIQNFILLLLSSGIYFPTRRSQDWFDFKISQIDLNEDNYLEGSKLIFNSYKGSKLKGKQTIKINKLVKDSLEKWISINPTKYLLFDKNEKQITAVHITQRLNKIFKRKVSTTMLRHIRTSHIYGGNIALIQEMENEFNSMGSSINMAKIYVKN
jgi:integrase